MQRIERLQASLGSQGSGPGDQRVIQSDMVGCEAPHALGLRQHLERAIANDSELVKPADYAARGWLSKLRDWLSYALLRFAIVVIARGRGY